jgi:pimeloyl-ACP methyl ester carboxylesterase
MNEAKYRAAEKQLWHSVGLQPAETFVTLPRFDTRVRIQTVGDGPPALFIHGGPNSGSTWATLVEHLPGFTCHLLDRPGTGLSERYPVTKENLIEFASGLVSEVLDALEIDRAHVVASSLGGYCALHSAASTPERFHRMVQMACPAMLPDQPLPQFMKAVMTPGLRRIIGVLPPSRKIQDNIMRQIGQGKSLDADKMPANLSDWYFALTKYTDTMRQDGDTIFSVRAKGGFDQSVALRADTLAKVTVPTHFLWGEDDAFGGEDVAHWIVGSMPDATLEMIPDSGHLPWLDEPRHIGQETARFLAGDRESTQP